MQELFGITLTDEEYDKLFCEQANGKELVVKDNKVIAVDRPIDNTFKIKEIENNFTKMLETEIEFNGKKYPLKWRSKLAEMYSLLIRENDTILIYDITGEPENALYMDKEQLGNLIITLRTKYEFYYNKMKKEIAYINAHS